MTDRWSRLAPLTSVAFVALLLATFIVGHGTPDSDATGAQVIHFYQAHRSRMMTSSFLGGYAAAFLLFWVAWQRAYLRRNLASDGLVALGFAGGVIAAVGGAIFSGLSVALSDVPSRLDPAAAQALNVLNNDMFLVFVVGMSGLFLGTGLAIVRSRVLPVWLGWVGFALGILAVTPAGFVVIFALMAWTLVVSGLASRRSRGPLAEPLEPTPAESLIG